MAPIKHPRFEMSDTAISVCGAMLFMTIVLMMILSLLAAIYQWLTDGQAAPKQRKATRDDDIPMIALPNKLVKIRAVSAIEDTSKTFYDDPMDGGITNPGATTSSDETIAENKSVVRSTNEVSSIQDDAEGHVEVINAGTALVSYSREKKSLKSKSAAATLHDDPNREGLSNSAYSSSDEHITEREDAQSLIQSFSFQGLRDTVHTETAAIPMITFARKKILLADEAAKKNKGPFYEDPINGGIFNPCLILSPASSDENVCKEVVVEAEIERHALRDISEDHVEVVTAAIPKVTFTRKKKSAKYSVLDAEIDGIMPLGDSSPAPTKKRRVKKKYPKENVFEQEQLLPEVIFEPTPSTSAAEVVPEMIFEQRPAQRAEVKYNFPQESDSDDEDY